MSTGLATLGVEAGSKDGVVRVWRPTASLMAGLACFAAGLGARLFGLGSKPFWLDEVTTLHRASLPFGRLVHDSLSFHHLPAYFVITSWFLGFGHDEVALRLPAVLFGAVSCGLACLVAAWLAGVEAGFAAGMLMAAAPIEVQYGQEARSYTLVLCLVLIALWGMLAWLAPASGRRWAGLAAYLGGTLGAVLVLGVGLAWWATANLGYAVAVRRRGGQRGLIAPWVWAQVAIGACAVPAYVSMTVLVEQAHGTFESGLDWIPRLSLHHVATAIQSLYLMRVSSLIADRVFPSPVALFCVVPLLLCGAGLFALRRTAVRRDVLLATTLACPLGMIAVSAVTPLLMPRYLLWGTGPFLVLAGVGIAAFAPRVRWAAAGAVALLGFVNLAPYYHVETKPRWEMAARMVEGVLAPGDMLLIDDPGAVDMMNVFLAREHLSIASSLWTTSVTEASCVLYGGRAVWALQGRVGQVDHEGLEQFLARVAPLGRPDEVRRIGLDITLMRYDHPAGDCAAQG